MVGSLRNLRASFTGTLLVVDESTFVSGEWMRGLPGITTATGVPPGVALLGDEHQLDGVEASKPFARLRQGGMMAAAMEENFRQRIAKLKSTTCRDACCPSEMLRRLSGRSTHSLSIRQGYRQRRDVGVGAASEVACTLH